MSIALPESMREYIDARLTAGHYGNTSEYIRDLVRRDQQEQAVLRPQARRDQRWQLRYYRNEAGRAVALRLARASHSALDQIERESGLGSPVLGARLDILGLRTWKITTFPLLWLYAERDDRLDVVRLLGERQDIATVPGESH